VQKHLITRDREAFEKQRWGADSDQASDTPFGTKKADEVETRTQLLCGCYVELIKMGESVFELNTLVGGQRK
jgi:hypothetical protein